MCFTVLIGTPITNSERKPVIETIVTQTPLESGPRRSRMNGVSQIIVIKRRALIVQLDPMCFSKVWAHVAKLEGGDPALLRSFFGSHSCSA